MMSKDWVPPVYFLAGANLWITNYCNRHCIYCCVNDWITNDSKSAQHMSLTNLKKVIDWLKASNIHYVQLLGGEPMLHPNVLDVINTLVNQKMIIRTILTNGLAQSDLYRKAAAISSRTYWLVNVNHPESYSDEEWMLLNQNLGILSWKNDEQLLQKRAFNQDSLKLQLSITFYQPKQEYNYIIDLAKKYNCTTIRYDPSSPSSNKSNTFVSLEELSELKPTIINFVKDCVQQGIKPGLECVLPPCIFTTKEWQYLMQFTDNIKSVCTPDLEIMPDLTIESCVSMRGILSSHMVGNSNALEILQRNFNHAIKFRNDIASMCIDCESFHNKVCQGYCLRLKPAANNRGSSSFLSKIFGRS
jgi:organic radical activating enzyme